MNPNKQESFQHFLDNNVNPQQKEAIIHSSGPLLVISGAGSGKTRVITARMTNLILQHNIHPSQIVALTFTNKAAKEMKERVHQFLGDAYNLPIVATFHSYCLLLLKKYQHLLPFQNFSIIDAQDQTKLLQTVLVQFNEEKLNVKQLLYAISSYKNSKLVDNDFDISQFPYPKVFLQIYNAYEQEKRKSHCLDFDDLLVYTLQLFKTNKEFKTLHQHNVRHILIDEYQDTNSIQNALLKEMALDTDNVTLAIDSICAVGDEDQAIYSWRGATVKNILAFSKEFKNTKTIKIEQNYRSTQSILNIANAIITNNKSRSHKELWSSKKSVHTPLYVECLSEYQEADAIVAFVQALQKKEPLNSVAILYRTHYQSRVLEEQCIKHSIPYKIIGGIQFYERKEIKDILAYLRLIVNPYDRVAFLRVINTPARGLGQKFEEEFINSWNIHSILPFTHIPQIMTTDGLLKGTKLQAVEQFINLYSGKQPTDDAYELFTLILQQTNYIEYLEEEFDKDEAKTKIENVQELGRAFQHFKQLGVSSLEQVLNEIALLQERIGKVEEANCIQLMTLHGAKGLEFDNVIITGLEEGILPSNQSIESDYEVEEERRLLYVGITRARQKLLLTSSRYRNTYGQTTLQQQSRFLQEIPTNLVLAQKAQYWNRTQFLSFFTQWIDGKTPDSTKTSTAQTFNTYQKPQTTQKEAPSFATDTKKKTWKPMLTVMHEKFGYGITHMVEEKNNKTYVTVRFTMHGVKKIDADFLKIV
jgi:DNA helicase-2/ATP-dependent DNA helicase PcrA